MIIRAPLFLAAARKPMATSEPVFRTTANQKAGYLG